GSFLSEISTPEVNFFFFGTGSFFPTPDWGLKSGVSVRKSGEKSAGRRRGKSSAEAGARSPSAPRRQRRRGCSPSGARRPRRAAPRPGRTAVSPGAGRRKSFIPRGSWPGLHPR
ncbi:unnamed protein product, partial [Rangifer tarandus platyrhynchus]